MKETGTTTASNPYKVGDILVAIFGYDMTIVEFYEVVRVTARKVALRELRQEQEWKGYLCGECVPVRGEYVNNAVADGNTLCSVRENGSVVVPYRKGGRAHSLASRWDGQPRWFNHCD